MFFITIYFSSPKRTFYKKISEKPRGTINLLLNTITEHNQRINIRHGLFYDTTQTLHSYTNFIFKSNETSLALFVINSYT